MTTQVGKPAPDFELEANTGQTIKLSDYRGKFVVLYFYPKDMTPTCTTQACDFRDYHKQFKKQSTVILGISRDPVSRHRKFIEKYNLPFVLLADIDHEVAEKYGVWKKKKMFGREYMGIERSTFVIDPKGTLIKEYRKISVKNHVEEVLQFINKAVPLG